MDVCAQIDGWAARLREGGPGDAAATPRRVGGIVDRALRGCRIDDAIRGATTITSGVWVLSRLAAAGVVPCGVADGTDAGLVDPRGADGVIDWSELAGILAARPFGPDRAWHQSFDTFASLRRRLAAMEFYGDLSDRRILQLGDDELFGMALAMVPDVRSVHVIDADPRILKYLDAEAADRGLPLTTQQVNVLRDRIAATDVDTFYVSGLKDAGGLLLFITSALATTTRPGAVGYISFDPDVYRAGMSDRDVARDVAKTVERLDCVVTAHFPGEDLLLDDELLAALGDIVGELAVPSASPADAAARLAALAGQPQPDLLVRKARFPDIALRPASVIRVETGPDSARLAARTLGFLQRSSREG